MTTSTTTVEKPEESIDDQDRADYATDAFMVGIDSEDRKHYFSRIRDAITVLDDGEHEHTEELDGRSLKDWMAFIEYEFGWTENNTFSTSPFEHLCEQLATAVNTGETQ